MGEFSLHTDYKLAGTERVNNGIVKEKFLYIKIYFYLFIYLFSFFPVGRGTLLQVSPITAGPFVQVCSGGGNSPQH